MRLPLMRYLLFLVLLYLFKPPPSQTRAVVICSSCRLLPRVPSHFYKLFVIWICIIIIHYYDGHPLCYSILVVTVGVNSCTCSALSSIITINYPWSVRRCPANCESAAILWSCCFTVHASIFCLQSATARSKPSTMLSDWRVSSSATSSSARSRAVSMINCKHTVENIILLIRWACEKVV